MILTRTPLRISIGGGGTDLPSYYREFGGFLISAAITKYVYIGLNRSFLPGYILHYSETEHVAARDEIRHRLIRETLTALDVSDPLEMMCMADVPAGTGLGSSGAFLVGLLHALYAQRGERVDAARLAAEAAEIEMTRLNDPVGKQDQYAAAYGGILCQEHRPDGTVAVAPLALSDATAAALRKSLMLFFVGHTRSSSRLLEDQRKKSEAGDQSMIESLHFTKQLGLEIKAALEAGRVEAFGGLMHEHWLRKRGRSAGISSSAIDDAYDYALRQGGATGGKLVGAGGGGFLLLQARDRATLREAMATVGMQEMDFHFDFEGSVVLLRDGAAPPGARPHVD
jgi:D-glycero-alpha-D-manno-heptose-7-phosphate kinase